MQLAGSKTFISCLCIVHNVLKVMSDMSCHTTLDRMLVTYVRIMYYEESLKHANVWHWGAQANTNTSRLRADWERKCQNQEVNIDKGKWISPDIYPNSGVVGWYFKLCSLTGSWFTSKLRCSLCFLVANGYMKCCCYSNRYIFSGVWRNWQMTSFFRTRKTSCSINLLNAWSVWHTAKNDWLWHATTSG